jgi:hypothetical protein
MTKEDNTEDAIVITDAEYGASHTEEVAVDAEAEAPKIVFGFAVLVDDKGNLFLERTPRIFNAPVERESTLIEVRRYAADIVMDIQAQASAEYTTTRMKSIKEEEEKDNPSA